MLVFASSVYTCSLGLGNWIIVFPFSMSTTAKDTKRHFLRMKAGVPSTVPVVLDMSASLRTSISTWWWGGMVVLQLEYKSIAPVLNFLFVCYLTCINIMWLENGQKVIFDVKVDRYFSKNDIPIRIVPIVGRTKKTSSKTFPAMKNRKRTCCRIGTKLPLAIWTLKLGVGVRLVLLQDEQLWSCVIRPQRVRFALLRCLKGLCFRRC